MSLNNAINGVASLSHHYPYLAIGIILLIAATLLKNKLLSYALYFLAFLAVLQQFSLFHPFVTFLKGLPDKIHSLINAFGGVK